MPHAQDSTLAPNARTAGATYVTRHPKIAPHGDLRQAALPADHPAVTENRPLFPSRVLRAGAVPRVLVSGVNSRKIGRKITKGSWAGMEVFTLTLPERSSCPPCGLKRECYGNGMPWAKRIAPGADLVHALDVELRALARRFPGGFAVRLHVLGDFYSLHYLGSWARWMRDLPQLHVWGYTAHAPDSEIGAVIEEANVYWPDRWVVRFSRNPQPFGGGRRQTTTIWGRDVTSPQQPEGLVCPASLDRTAACVTCGLCWDPSMADTPIVFVGHGKRGRGPSATAGTPRAAESSEYQRGYTAGYAAGKRWKKREARA